MNDIDSLICRSEESSDRRIANDLLIDKLKKVTLKTSKVLSQLIKLFTKLRTNNISIFHRITIETYEKYNTPSNTLTAGPIR